MLYLVLTIVCGSALSVVMRLSEGRIRARISMLAFNYLTCTLLAAAGVASDGLLPRMEGAGTTLALGLVNGLFYMTSLVLMQHNIRKNGVILPTIFSKLGSLLLPVFVAMLAFGERPGAVQLAGAGLAAVSIVMLSWGDGQRAVASVGLLIALLLSDGVAGSLAKIFREIGPGALSDHFLMYTFASALALSAGTALLRRERPGLREAAFGVMIGVPNFLASRFLLGALETIPAVVAYPTRGMATLLLVTLAGVCFFRERLKPRQWAAFGVVLAAVAMLNL